MQYSPKLKRVAEQIKKLLKDNDIAGLVVLHTPGFSEYVNEITPSYSAIEWNVTKDSVIIKGKAEHYGGNKAKRDKKLADTANMLTLISETGGTTLLSVMQLSDKVKEVWNHEHTKGNHSSDTEQNN